jgi:hypothetical protein
MVMSANLPVIGRNDIADFPVFKLQNVRIKTDSGAYTSTIHCKSIKEIDGRLDVIFLETDESGYTGETVRFTKFDRKLVRSSSGEQQERYIVEGDILLFGKVYQTEFTLSSRDQMRYPVLLGRKLLSENFIINTILTNLSYKQKNQ